MLVTISYSYGKLQVIPDLVFANLLYYDRSLLPCTVLPPITGEKFVFGLNGSYAILI